MSPTCPLSLRRRLGSVFAVIALALAAGLAGSLPGSAATVPLGTYSAALPVVPFPTVAGGVDPAGLGFPITFTNTSPSGYELTSVQVTLPAGFTATGSPTVSAAGWTTSTSGSTVSASRGGPLGGIPAAGTVRVTLHAIAPATSGSYAFTTAAQGLIASTGIVGDFTNAGTEPAVEVHPFANVVTCAPDEICDTGEIGSSTGTQARIVTTTGAIQDFVGISVQAPTDTACLALLEPGSISDQITFGSVDTGRTLTQTVRLDKSKVNAFPNNGVGQFSVCYNTQNSPSRTTFVDRTGATVTVGFLPRCGTAGLPADNPCVLSATKSAGGDALVTFTAPGGDPTDIVGLPAAVARGATS